MTYELAPYRNNILVSLRDGQHPDAVYIGRPGIWGNPFEVGQDMTLTECVTAYEQYVRNNTQLMGRLGELSNKQLACWCYPSLCHGDALIKLMLENRIPILKMPINTPSYELI